MIRRIADQTVLADSQSEPRDWPARRAWLGAWTRPATTATRTARLPLGWAFGVHVLAGLASTVLIVALISAEETYSRFPEQSFAPAFIARLSDNVGEIVTAVQRHPVQVIAVLLTVGGLIEFGFLALTLLVMPWGARDERLRESFRAALRQTWLHSTHALPAMLLGGALVLAIDIPGRNWQREFHTRNPFTANWPGPPPTTAPADSPERAAYDAKVAAHNAAYSAYSQRFWRERPWYVAWDEPLIGIGCLGLGAWVLWALLRAVGAPRPVVVPEHPPMCEWCGYNLTLTPLEGRCPECGQPVNDSLGPQARPGTAWERSSREDAARSWRTCAIEVIRRPAMLGRLIRLSPSTTRHRRFPWRLYPIMAVLGGCGLFCVYIVERLSRGLHPFAKMPNDLPIIAVVLSFVFPIALLVIALAAAAVVGIGLRLTAGRNLMSSAMQMSCYLTPLSVLAAVWGLATFTGVIINEERFRALRSVTRIDDEVLAVGAWSLLNAPIFIAYLVLLVRGTAATRYANH